MRILIVEDEVRLAEALAQIMAEQKYQVDQVHNGADGLDYALTAQYDVIVLDVMLPKLDGLSLLRRVAELLREKGYEIGNVDCTIRAQQPRLRPHIDAMRRAMAGAMGVDDDRVSVKATTTEHLGFEGREEGISVSAVALIYRPADRK